MSSVPLDVGGFRGLARINGYAADVDLAPFREFDGNGAVVSEEVTWSGKAAILNPPSFNLLEFTGVVEVAIGSLIAGAAVVDATPGSGFIYVDGVGEPPFDTSLLENQPTGVTMRFRAPYGVDTFADWQDGDAVGSSAELTA